MPTYVERTEVDKIEILETGDLQIREVLVVERDGVEIARSFTRRCLLIEADPTTEPNARVRAIAQSVRGLPNRPKPPAVP